MSCVGHEDLSGKTLSFLFKRGNQVSEATSEYPIRVPSVSSKGGIQSFDMNTNLFITQFFYLDNQASEYSPKSASIQI